MSVLAVILGAAIGAPSRFVLDGFVQRRHATSLPWGTIVVNALGSLVIGVVAGSAPSISESAPVLALVNVGFCGALTTFSTFSLETIRLVEDGEPVSALLNVTVSLIVTIGLCVTGYLLGGLAT